MLRTLAIISNKIVLSFGVLIAFLSPKQSEIEESSLESISKTRMQGLWAGCQNDVARLVHFSHSTRMTSGILLRRHFTRMSHIPNSGAGWERRAFQLLRIYISESSNSVHPENFAAIFCTVAWCSPEASRYV